MDSGNVFYAIHERVLVLKFVGEIRYTMGESYRISASLDSFLDTVFEEGGFDSVLLDLTETSSIDSTNLGLIAKIAQHGEQKLGKKPTIISTNADIDAILDSVGFEQVFNIVHELPETSAELDALPQAEAADRELAQMLLDAHKALTSLNDKNKAMFKNVVQLLEKKVQDS